MDIPSALFGESPSFTPVKRPLDNIKDSPRRCNDPVLWSGARCKRLLRPITSRLATLRKDARCGGIDASLKVKRKNSANSDGRKRKPNEDWVNDEAENESVTNQEVSSRRPQKRLRRTRSVKDTDRRKSKSQLPSQDITAIKLVRPLLRRDALQNHMATPFPSEIVSPPQDSATHNKRASTFSAKKPGKITRAGFRTLVKNVCPTQWMIYDGIYSGLETLLKATIAASSLSTPRIGAPSLFSTCIRRLPHWIAQEEAKAKLTHPDHDDDIEGTLFTDLEFLSTASDGSWKPFRDICRSQAVLLLAEAIEEGLMPLSIVDSLVHLFIDDCAINEAKIIVRSMVVSIDSIRDPKSHEESLYSHEISYALHALKRLPQEHMAFTFEIISLLLQKDALSVQWCMHPDIIYILNRALHSITTLAASCPEAVALVEVAIRRWAHNAMPSLLLRSFAASDERGGTGKATRNSRDTRDPLNSLIGYLIFTIHCSSLSLKFDDTGPVLPGYSIQALKGIAIGHYRDYLNTAKNVPFDFSTLALVLACPEFSNEFLIEENVGDQQCEAFMEFAAQLLDHSSNFVAEELEVSKLDVLQLLVESWLSRPATHVASWLLHESSIRAALRFVHDNDKEEHHVWVDNLVANHDSNVKESTSNLVDLAKPSVVSERIVIVEPFIPESFKWDERLGDFVVCSPMKIPRILREQSENNDDSEAEQPQLDIDAICDEAVFTLGEEVSEGSTDGSISDTEYQLSEENQNERLPFEPWHAKSFSKQLHNKRGIQSGRSKSSLGRASGSIPAVCGEKFSKMEKSHDDTVAARLIEDAAQDLLNLSFDLDNEGGWRQTVAPIEITKSGVKRRDNHQRTNVRPQSHVFALQNNALATNRIIAPRLKNRKGPLLAFSSQRSIKQTQSIGNESDDELCT